MVELTHGNIVFAYASISSSLMTHFRKSFLTLSISGIQRKMKLSLSLLKAK